MVSIRYDETVANLFDRFQRPVSTDFGRALTSSMAIKPTANCKVAECANDILASCPANAQFPQSGQARMSPPKRKYAYPQWPACRLVR